MKKLTDKQRREIAVLRQLPDDQIDTADIPEVRDWSRSERGKFYRPGISLQTPIYLDPDVMEAVQKRAQRKHMDTSKLVSEILRKDLVRADAAK